MSFLLLIVLNCCLGSFFSGLSVSQMNIIHSQINEVYGITDPAIEGLIQSILTIGGAFGALFSTSLLKIFSRKNCLLVADFISISAIMLAVAETTVTTLLLARLILGICIGLNAVFVPLYIKEMSPVAQSGTMGSFNSLLGTFGTLTSFGLGYMQNYQMAIPFYKFVLLFPAIPCLIRMTMLRGIFNYETPPYCFKNNLRDKLGQILGQLSDTQNPEYRQLIKSNHDDAPVATKQIISGTSVSELFEIRYRKRFLLGISLSILQQFSGVNAIIFYSSQIFDKVTGHDTGAVQFLNLIIGIIGVVTSILAGVFIDKSGRRTILMYGTLICYFSLQLLTLVLLIPDPFNNLFAQTSIVALMFVYLFGYGFSLGPLLFIYLTEILPEQGISIAAFINWMSAGIVAQFFPVIANYGMIYCFAIFSFFNFVGYILIWMYMIETKGLNEKQIEHRFSYDMAKPPASFNQNSYMHAFSEDTEDI